MANFAGTTLTQKGLALQAKAQIGTRLEFTRMAVGDGVLGGQSLASLTALIHETHSLPIVEMRVIGQGQSLIKALFSNETLTDGYFMREIGLFARDPDEGEILYCITNAMDTADYIPPGTGPNRIEEVISLVTVIGEATNISVVIDSQIYASLDQLLEHTSNEELHVTRSEIQTELSRLRNKIELIEATYPDNFNNNLFTEDLLTLDSVKLTKGYFNESQSRIEV